MRASDMFLSFEGRLDRERFLGGCALLVTLVLMSAVWAWAGEHYGLVSAEGGSKLVVFAAASTVLPFVALAWKRFEDRGWPGFCALALPGVVIANMIWDMPSVAALAPWREEIGLWLLWAHLAVIVWFVIELGGLPGLERHGKGVDRQRVESRLVSVAGH